MAEYTIEFWRETHEFLIADVKKNYVASVKIWKDEQGDFMYEIYRKDELVHSSYERTAQESMEKIAEWAEQLTEPNVVIHPGHEIMERMQNGN